MGVAFWEGFGSTSSGNQTPRRTIFIMFPQAFKHACTDVMHPCSSLGMFRCVCCPVAALLFGVYRHPSSVATIMPSFPWPFGVPRSCSFRFGNEHGCGSKAQVDKLGHGERLLYRMCPVGHWMMCPVCYDKLLAEQFGDDDESWRGVVTKDGSELAASSRGAAVSGATTKVKHVMKKPAAK